MNDGSKQFRKVYSAFYADHAGIQSLLQSANSVCSPRFPIHGCLFATGLNAAGVRDFLAEGRRKVRGFSVSGEDCLRVEVPPRSNPSPLPHSGTAKGFLLLDGSDGVACLIGLSTDFDYVWAELRRYMHPNISTLYLRTREFKQAFLHISQNPSSVEVRGFTANVLCDDGQKVKTRREWLPAPKPMADFFMELEQETQWLRSVEVVLTSPSASGRVKRDLVFSCHTGFEVFLRTILGSLRATAASSRGFLQNRSVSDSPTHASRPLRIAYASGVFDDKRQNHRLIRVLRKQADTGVSVFHANPFLHASIVDYADGSTYTVWVTDNAAITIVPGVKATVQSLARLCNHINEHFEEGLVEEAAL